MLARLLVEQLLRTEHVTSRCPGMRGAAWNELVAEVLCRDSTVPESTLQLVCCLVVETSGGIEGVAHSGN
jgi:hypothetical protein